METTVVHDNYLNPQQMARMAVFAVVAHEENLTRAADRLGLSKSAVSKQLTALESELGLRLLFRNARRTRLTEQGRALLPLCDALWQQQRELLELAEDLKDSVSGRLTLELPGGLARSVVLDCLPEFGRRYPLLELVLRLGSTTPSSVGEDVDVALVAGELPDSSLICRKLGDIQTRAYASPSYLDQWGTPEHPEQLMQHRCIRMNYPGVLDADCWVFVQGESVQKLRVPAAFVVDDSMAAMQLAESGAGIAMLQHFAVEAAVSEGRIKGLLEGYDCPSVPLYVVYPERQYLAPKVRAVVDFLADIFRQAGF